MSETNESSRAASGHALAPWLAQDLAQLRKRQAHALLIEGPSGLGQWPLALALAHAWLCDEPTEQGACGQCASCHLLAARTHPDLFVLMPEVQALALAWPLESGVQAELDDKKRKPSKEIRAEAAAGLNAFAQRTPARGRGKVALIHPAERMNATSASSLLKVLEEPLGQLRLVLASEAGATLLPTIRSRCQSHLLTWPDAAQAVAWMVAQGVAHEAASVWLAACGGRPLDAMHAAGASFADWQALPERLRAGSIDALEAVLGVEPSAWVDTLQKLCHDLMAIHVGAQPRFFAAASLGKPPEMPALIAWGEQLHRHARHAHHPLNPGLLLELLGAQCRSAMAGAR